MTPHRIPRLASIIIAPMRSMGELSLPSWLVAVAGGCGSFLRADAVIGGILIALALGIADYWVGYTRAKIRNELDPHVAQLGLLSKFTGIALVLGVRALEWWLQETIAPWPNTDGVVAAVICAALIVRELHSLNEKGVRLPIVTQVLLGIESWLVRLIPADVRKEP